MEMVVFGHEVAIVLFGPDRRISTCSWHHDGCRSGSDKSRQHMVHYGHISVLTKFPEYHNQLHIQHPEPHFCMLDVLK